MKSKLSISAILLLIGWIGSAQVNLDSGLVAKYYFNGNTNDQSGNGHDGVGNTASLTTNRFDESNSAYLFDGSGSKIDVPNSNAWNFGSADFTISSWVRVNTINTGRIISAGYDANDSIQGLGFGTNLGWGSGIRINYFNFRNGYADYNSDALSYTTGQWAHIAVVNSNNVMTFYFNSVPSGTAAIGNSSNSNSQLTIGARQQAANYFFEFFDGKIDDIGIWNRALSASEIHLLYTSMTGINEFAESGSFQIYPNPSSGMCKVISDQHLNEAKIKVYNAFGQIVFQNESDNDHSLQLNLSHQPNAIYFSTMSCDGATYSTKFIIQH